MPRRIVTLVIFFVTLIHCASQKHITGALNVPPLDRCHQCMVLTEQSQNRIVVVDAETKKLLWEWKAETSNVKPEHVKWFTNPSDAKPVYENRYVLITASGGGVALVRITDRKTVFYAYAGGNPHSAELLPDGNIVSASSTDSFLTVFKMDTTVAPDQVYHKRFFIAFGHNVVWDKERQLLWSAAMNKLKAFRYNNNCSDPELTLVDSIPLPGTEAHDLFPQFSGHSLWITNTTQVYRYDVREKRLLQDPGIGAHVKSISDGPAGHPVIISRPKEKWWTDEVIDIDGKSIFKQAGWRIYKARWWERNFFSYSGTDSVKVCR